MIDETVPEGFQKTEVGIIPNDWSVKPIGKFTDVISGGTPSTNVRDFWGGSIRWMNSGELNLKKVFEVEGRITEKGLQNSATKLVPINCVLIGLAGQGKTRGTVAMNFVPLCTNQSIASILPCDEVSYYYLYQNLDLRYKELRSLSTGDGGRGGLNLTLIKNLEIPLPPTKDEQTAIANALNDADELITRLEQLIAKKRLIKQGAMQELLKPKDDWEVKKLGEIANIVGGGTPSTFNLSYWNGNINWFTPTEIGKTKYTFESVRKITKQGLENCSAKLLQAGTILLTSRASIGDISILMNDACTNQGFQSLVPKSGFSNEFVYYLMLTIKNLLVQNASGSTFLEISPNKLKQIEVSVPVISEQTRIAQILSDMDAEIEALETKLAKYKMLKQGMMQNLLTGKIRLIVNGEL
jgi:type I restriction enzyme S subunit